MNRDRKRNVQTLLDIIDKHGWPTIPMVGEDGFEAAWVIAQHADFDVEFQKIALGLIEQLPVSDKLLSKQAYLQDRVLVNSKLPQLFGTQFHEVDGRMAPRPIQTMRGLDERRRKFGLGPFVEYMKRFEGSNEDATRRSLEANRRSVTTSPSA
jgi:hypothetical protein